MTSEFDRQQNLELFRRANELTAPIEDTNQRLDTLNEHQELANEPEFYAIAQNGLRTEQQAAFDTLTAEIPTQPYADMYAEYSKTNGELEELEISLAGVRESMTAEQRRYDDLVRAVTQIAPLGEADATKLAERRKSEIELAESARIRDDIEAKKAELAAFDELYEETGKAWPIPRLLMQAAGTTVTTATEEFEDEIPVEPKELKPSERRRLEKLEARHVFQPKASLYAVFYLTEHSGQVVTVDEMVNFLYPDDIEEKSNKVRSLVTSMLGPVHGERVHKMLTEEGDGYLLQYGWRRRINPETGEPCGARYRIYRALELSDIDAVDDVIRYTEDIDSFDGAEAHPEIEAPKLDTSLEVVSTEEAVAETELTEQPEAPEEDAESSSAPQNIPPRPREPIAKRTTPRGTGKKTAAKKAPAKKAASKEGAKRQTWQDSLKKSVGEAITLLEKDGLMRDERIPANVVSVRSSSNLMGTQTAMERMESAGVLSAPNDHANKQRYPLSTVDRVVMFIFNGNSSCFSERTRRKTAMKIVEEAVASYYEKNPDMRQAGDSDS